MRNFLINTESGELLIVADSYDHRGGYYRFDIDSEVIASIDEEMVLGIVAVNQTRAERFLS